MTVRRRAAGVFGTTAIALFILQSCALDPNAPGSESPPPTVSVYFEGRNVDVVEGKEIRIRFREDSEESVRQRIIMQYGFYADRIMLYGYFIYYMNIMNPGRIESVVRMLRGHAEVEEAEPNIPDGRSPFDL